ncbi:MAG TPA: aminodeoxychorismate/anthranilate synthase component II [Aquifex sp.]|nr:aminodeoxychorismate/anthranilate synthase component II [Aquifex sp.]
MRIKVKELPSFEGFSVHKKPIKVLMVDNYDSFTYNIVHYLAELGADVTVKRNDEITVEEIADYNPDALVISPGPCTPHEAGISVQAIRRYAGKLPILGVCLGHQSIGVAFGAKIRRARTLKHGKSSKIEHTGKGILKGLPNPFEAIRYHSLVIDETTLPEVLEVVARSLDDNEIMAVRHKELPIFGVQFHPESIGFNENFRRWGLQILKNFLEEAEKFKETSKREG